MRERRDAKKKQEQEAVENKLRRIQLRESSYAIRSKEFHSIRIFHENNIQLLYNFRIQTRYQEIAERG